MTDLLSDDDLAAVKSAMQDLVDTFMKMEIVLMSRSTVLGAYGESASFTPKPYTLKVMGEYTKGRGERYRNVEEDPTGEQVRDGYRFYLWKEAVDAIVTIDPETDKVLVNGHEYIIFFWGPSAQFSSLGYLFYEMEVSLDTAVEG